MGKFLKRLDYVEPGNIITNLWSSQRGVGASQLLLGCRVGVESAPSLLHFGDLYFGQNKPPPDQSWVWQLYLQDPISTKIQPVLLNSWHHKIGAGKGWNAKQKTYIPSADVPLFHNYLFISFLSQESTRISYTLWFISQWTKQNDLLKIISIVPMHVRTMQYRPPGEFKPDQKMVYFNFIDSWHIKKSFSAYHWSSCQARPGMQWSRTC